MTLFHLILSSNEYLTSNRFLETFVECSGFWLSRQNLYFCLTTSQVKTFSHED